MEQLELYVPKLEDLWFYQKMMSDPETMSYNANWDVNYDGYHRDTGCVDYPDAVLPAWYENMVGQEPERFYAYIKRSADGAWIGDVNFHYNPAKDWWDMGIVLYAPYRGKGYAVPALKLMLEHAFRDCGISRIHNDFEVARNEISAWETHRRAGFRELGVEDGFLQMMITKEDYFAHLDTDWRSPLALPLGELSPQVTERVLHLGLPSPSSLRSDTSPKERGKGVPFITPQCLSAVCSAPPICRPVFFPEKTFV